MIQPVATVEIGTGPRTSARSWRVLALACGISAGLAAWDWVQLVTLEPANVVTARGVTAVLLALACFGVLGWVASLGAGASRWQAVTEQFALAAAGFAVGAADLVFRRLYSHVLYGEVSRPPQVALWGVVLVLSLGLSAASQRPADGLLVGPGPLTTKAALMRALAVVAAAMVGLVFAQAAEIAVVELLRGVVLVPQLEEMARELILGAGALALALRPARLRAAEGVLLIGAGLAAAPLLALALTALTGSRPTRATAGFVVLAVLGVAVGLAAARRCPGQDMAMEAGRYSGAHYQPLEASEQPVSRWTASAAVASVPLLAAALVIVPPVDTWGAHPRSAAGAESAAATPADTTPPRPPAIPAGFLTVPDLGSGWAQGTLQGDNGTVSDASVPGGSGCAPVSLPTAAAGYQVTYRGSQPLGDKEWLLNEQLTTLTTAGASTAKASLEQASAGCPGQTVLFRGTTIGGDYALALRFSNTVGMATAYSLVGDHLIILTTLPGGASGQNVPLPGGTPWLEHVTRLAAQQATYS